MEFWLLAILPVLGIVFGAGAQFLASTLLDARRERAALKAPSYTDFLRAVGGIVFAQRRKDSVAEQTYREMLMNAKSRIALYGSREVLKSIADFWRMGGAALGTTEQMAAFRGISEAMRREYLGQGPTVSEDIDMLLFGEELIRRDKH